MEQLSVIFFYPDAEIYSFQVLWVDFPKLPLKIMPIDIKLIIGTLALLIFDRNLIPMPFPIITHILSTSVSQTCVSLWPGPKEPPAKKSKKDCQKEYELHRKPRSFRNEWAVDRPWLRFSEGAMFCTVCTNLFDFNLYIYFWE